MKVVAALKNFLVRYLCPDAYAESVADIDLPFLKEKGYRALILDLDNTLVSWKGKEIPEKISSWLKEADRLGYKQHIVSNSLTRRVSHLSAALGIPFTSRAAKPRKKVFLEALQRLCAKPDETVIIGDQLFTDILGGKRMGIFTILVSPVDKKEFFTTALFRIPERMILAFLRKQALLKPSP